MMDVHSAPRRAEILGLIRRGFVAASVGWAALLPMAPVAASQPAPAPFWYPLAFLVYGAGSVVCHQLPERSFHLDGAPWAVCARCAGIYVGAALTAAVAALSPNWRLPAETSARSARILLAVAILPTLVTLGIEWTSGVTPSNGVRAVSGAPLGAAVAFMVMSGLR